MFEAYGWALAICGVLIIAARNSSVLLYAVLASNWCAWSLFITLTGIYEPWQFGIVVDSAAMLVLLHRPSNRIRAILAASYCIQVAMHIAFGLVVMTRGVSDVDLYANWLGYIGWAQLSLVGGHAGGGIWRRVRHRWDAGIEALAHPYLRDYGPRR